MVGFYLGLYMVWFEDVKDIKGMVLVCIGVDDLLIFEV